MSRVDEVATIELSFEGGVPVALNGVEMPLVDLTDSLSFISGLYGVGAVNGSLQAFKHAMQEHLTGPVRLKLQSGHCEVLITQ